MSLREPSGAECLAVFKKTDSIMEPRIIDFLTAFIDSGGSATVAVTELSKSYVSLAQMVNLLADWMVQLGMEPAKIQELIENHYYNLVVKHFDPKKADKIFTIEGKVPDWLGGLVENHKWRKMIYELAEEYPDCLMLTFTVKLIAESGFQGEITGVATASQQLEVFSGVLNTGITNIIAAEASNDIDDLIKELSSIVKYGEHSFLYSINLLSYLAESPYGGSMASRIKQEIIKSTGDENIMDIVVMNFAVSCAPMNSQAVHAMSSMLSKKQLNPADITILYKLYQFGQPTDKIPTVNLLREPIFLDLLIASLFSKSPKINLDHKSKYIYLLAYSVSVFEDWKISSGNGNYTRTVLCSDDLNATLGAVEKVTEILWKKGSGRELMQEVEVVFECLRTPVVSFGVTKWVEEVVQDDSFYDRSTEPTPIPFLLLDEVVNLHPLQHEHVFKLLKKLFLYGFASLSTHAKLDLEKVIVDRLIHLICSDFVIPVVDFFASCLKDRSADISIIRYFLFQLLDLIAPPFSEQFLHSLQPLCTDESLSDALRLKASENFDIQTLVDRIDFVS